MSFSGPTTREPTPTFPKSSSVDYWTNQGTGAQKIASIRPPSPRIHAPPMLSGMTPPCACVYACVRICMRAYMHAGAPRHDLTIHVHAYTQRTCKIPKVATQGRFVHFCVLHAGSHMRLCAYMCFMAAFVCTYAGQLGCT